MNNLVNELNRLAFVKQRDGVVGAIAFAKQGISVYRAALAQRNRLGFRCGYGKEYRKTLVESLIVYRRFLRSNHDEL